MEVDIKNKKFAILGIQGSGKTVLAKFLSMKMPTVIYTPHYYEWRRQNGVYIYYPYDYKNELDLFTVAFKQSKRFKMVIFDEFDMAFQNNAQLPHHMNDLIINHRHYGKTVGFITRRPQDIPAKIIEQCHYLFIYTIEGKNVIQHLNDIHKGMGDMAKKIPYKSYHFILKEIGQKPKLMEPIDTSDLFIVDKPKTL